MAKTKNGQLARSGQLATWPVPSCSRWPTPSTTGSRSGARPRRRINYRRFFDVSDLAALQADDPEVFDASHRLVLELVAAGQVTGLRIDHVDGLRDPKAYLDRLARESGRAYVVVEKILQRSEPLRRDWPVEGTTGYEFLDAAGGLAVDGVAPGPSGPSRPASSASTCPSSSSSRPTRCGPSTRSSGPTSTGSAGASS